MNNTTKKLVLAAILAALAGALKTFSDLAENFIGGQGRTLSFFSIPLIMAGYYCGPWLGLAAGFVADVAYAAMPFTQGKFGLDNLFTITTMIWGLTGFFIRKIKFNPRLIVILILVIVTSMIETSLNTLFAYWFNYTKQLELFRLIKRIVARFVRVPISVIVTNTILTRLDILYLE